MKFGAWDTLGLMKNEPQHLQQVHPNHFFSKCCASWIQGQVLRVTQVGTRKPVNQKKNNNENNKHVHYEL